jgi:tRNA(fMet)-specific endonuclease VapC
VTHLVDSDVLFDAVNGRSSALDALELLGPRNMNVSVISIGEFLDGIVFSPNYLRRHTEFNRFLLPFQILDVDHGIMARFASIRAELGREGRMIADFDIVIVCTAMERGLALLSRNRKHFERIPELRFVTPDDVLKG